MRYGVMLTLLTLVTAVLWFGIIVLVFGVIL